MLERRAVLRYYQDLKDGIDRSVWAKANAHILDAYRHIDQKVLYEAWLKEQASLEEQTSALETNKSTITIGPLGAGPSVTKTKRWPRDSINTNTDYIYFEFGKYIAPFGKEAEKLRDSLENKVGSEEIAKELTKKSNKAATYEMYNSSAENLKVSDTYATIMLPMPQDLSTESNQQWQGKQFTATGRAATAALAAGQFSYASEVVKNIAGNATALQTAFNTTVLNSIPGVGGNLEFNDVSGSTQGIVINPNAELLYDAPEMREIGMIFKMVPKNADESRDIKEIIKVFRAASMPSWGKVGVDILKGEATTGQSNLKEDKNDGDGENKSEFDIGGQDNWIRVPYLCKFTFMHGSKANQNIIQYKACAISGVEVNYTPDGTYAAHANGHPVAIEMRLNFMETKLIFADEVGKGF